MLPPEVEEGNNEYKCYFKNIKKERFIELSTQMNWRLNEGNGIAYYYIGVNDDGTIYDKLNKKQIKYSLLILNQLASKNNSIITEKIKSLTENKTWFKIEIKRKNIIVEYKEYRVLLLGDTKSGKTTFISNLVKQKLNVNGNANKYSLNHKHEIISGETSSINYFSVFSNDINYLFFDSPGNEKYINTLLKISQTIPKNHPEIIPKSRFRGL